MSGLLGGYSRIGPIDLRGVIVVSNIMMVSTDEKKTIISSRESLTYLFKSEDNSRFAGRYLFFPYCSGKLTYFSSNKVIV